MINIKQLTDQDIEWNVEAEPEDIPIQGNAGLSDDQKRNERIERSIAKQLKTTQWAWCAVVVTGTYKGITATDCLGCCNYKSKEDFLKNSGYYKDMQNNCLMQLQTTISDIVNAVVIVAP